jgi:hypothetical protein
MEKTEPAAYSDPTAWHVNRGRIPPEIWELVREHYVRPITSFYYATGIRLVPSLNSVYRPQDHEIERGRSGSSLHCFPPGTKGAADLTLEGGGPVIHVLDRVIDELPFRRICVYPEHNFLHVDYGEPGRRSGDRRSLWQSASLGGPWIRMSWLAEPVI